MNTVQIKQGPIVNPKIGQIYKHEEGELYILAQVNATDYCLISLCDGNRYNNAVSDISSVFSDKPFSLVTKTEIKIITE